MIVYTTSNALQIISNSLIITGKNFIVSLYNGVSFMLLNAKPSKNKDKAAYRHK